MITKKQQAVYNIKSLLKQLHVANADSVQACEIENNSYVISGVHNLTLVLYDVMCTDDNYIPAHVTLYKSDGPYSEDVKESDELFSHNVTDSFDLHACLIEYGLTADDPQMCKDVYELITNTFK